MLQWLKTALSQSSWIIWFIMLTPQTTANNILLPSSCIVEGGALMFINILSLIKYCLKCLSMTDSSLKSIWGQGPCKVEKNVLMKKYPNFKALCLKAFTVWLNLCLCFCLHRNVASEWGVKVLLQVATVGYKPDFKMIVENKKSSHSYQFPRN